MYSLIIEGLNKRLGLHGDKACAGNSSYDCIALVLSERNMTFPQATAIPEEDSWRYDASPAIPEGNYSMMCSAFVANALKVGFGSHWPILNSHEFTPKDVYQLAIYDNGTRFTEQSCPGGTITDANGKGT